MDDTMKPLRLKQSMQRNSPERQELIARLQADVSVHRLMKQQGIPEAELLSHPYLFQRYLNEVEPCRGCTSLSSCRQKQRGYHMGLHYDGILQETVAACRYERDHLKDEAQMERYLICDFGEALRSVRFQNIQLDGEPSDYITAVLKLNAYSEEGKGVFLYGNMGTGKTYLAACAANRAADQGESVVFLHYPSFCDRIAVTMYSGEYRKEADYCRAAGMLVIDDIGAEEVTERNRMVLLSILDSRMQKGRMTWFTGNVDLNSLREHLRTARGKDSVSAADRIIERIRALTEPVYLGGNDRRKLCSLDG